MVRVTAQVRNRTGLWAEVKVRATKVRLKFGLGLDSRGHESKSIFQGRIRVTVKVSSRAKGQNLSGDKESSVLAFTGIKTGGRKHTWN